MSYDTIDYGELIDEAMHLVVRRALEFVEQHGLPADHHFFITFATEYPGVMISDELAERYPEEMTIVVQHQFWDLEIEEDRFSIVLSFDNVKQNLTIPFDALISFADPSVKFGLQFNTISESVPGATKPSAKKPRKHQPAQDEHEPVTDGSNIVSLDTFRKK